MTHLTSWHMSPNKHLCFSSQEDQDPLTSRILILPSSLLSLCLLSCTAIFIGVASCINSVTHLALSPLSVSLPVWFFQPLITCLLFSTSSLCCLYTFSFQPFLSIFQCWNTITSFSDNSCPLLFIFASLFLLPLTLSHLLNMWFSFPLYIHVMCLDWTSPLPLLTSLPSLIEWPLFYDHLSLLPLLFPLPSLSISLGGPAFLPGFCRPRCENWRWRGRWRRRTRRRSSNQRSRPQSLFLRHFLWQLTPQWSPPSNHRPSLSPHSSSTS